MATLRSFVTFLILIGTVSSALAETTYYLRHREVEGRRISGDIYVEPSQLATYFEPDELKRIVTGRESVKVDGRRVASVGPGGMVPLVAVARRLGFQVRSNEQVGIIDIIPPQALVPSINRTHQSEKLDGSKREEYQLAALRMKKIVQKLGLYDDPVSLARIRRIGNKVASVSPLGGLEWHFFLLDSDIPNAACTGEGWVFVTKGLIGLDVSDDELAGVLGHEVAHGVRRHPFKRLDLLFELDALLKEFKKLDQKAVELANENDDSKLIDLRRLETQLKKKAKSLEYRLQNVKVYARKDEEEADILGMRYAVMAGYSEGGLASCLRKLEQATISRFGEAVFTEDMSHPPVSRRLEILQKVRSDWH